MDTKTRNELTEGLHKADQHLTEITADETKLGDIYSDIALLLMNQQTLTRTLLAILDDH